MYSKKYETYKKKYVLRDTYNMSAVELNIFHYNILLFDISKSLDSFQYPTALLNKEWNMAERLNIDNKSKTFAEDAQSPN